MQDNFLSQLVNVSTRKENILDLFLSNSPQFIHLVKVDDLLISDHKLVKVIRQSKSKVHQEENI